MPHGGISLHCSSEYLLKCYILDTVLVNRKNNKARAPILGLFLFNVYPINKED